jgi:hypothetical protein
MPYQRNTDGSWTPAEPIPPRGRIARLEHWMRSHGHRRIALILGRLDERGW